MLPHLHFQFYENNISLSRKKNFHYSLRRNCSQIVRKVDINTYSYAKRTRVAYIRVEAWPKDVVASIPHRWGIEKEMLFCNGALGRGMGKR